MIQVKWDEERKVLVPMPSFLAWLTKTFRHGQRMFIERIELRSMDAHKRFFAEFTARWNSMPEHIRRHFINATHLRKHALIRCEWIAEMRTIACGTPEAAVTGAVCAKTADPYVMIAINGPVVTIYKARSMAMSGDRCMKAKEFYQAANDVLDFCGELLGIAKNETETFPEFEEAADEALVRIGKAHHPAQMRITDRTG